MPYFIRKQQKQYHFFLDKYTVIGSEFVLRAIN